jgi:hypothetical protein
MQSQFNSCTYCVLISVWDYMTIMRPISSALVKFKTSLIGTITNTTDLGGKTMISLSLEKNSNKRAV